MKFTLPVKYAHRLQDLLNACDLLQDLARSRRSFRKRVEALLAEKDGEERLRAAVREVTQVLNPLRYAPCEVACEVAAQIAGEGGTPGPGTA